MKISTNKKLKEIKVLFVITNINGTYNDVYSFGLASLASITRDSGFEYEYFIINSLNDYETFFDFVESFKPRVIAYTAVSSQFAFIQEMSEKIKEKYQEDIIQVCGGVHVTIFPKSILGSKGLDGIFIGESEYAFSDFLNRVASGRSFSDVQNFAYDDQDTLQKNPLYPLVTDLDKLPYPERDKYKYERFIQREGYAVFMFSRGCPFSCSYCSNHALAKTYNMKVNMPRYRSPQSSIDEIKEMIDKYSIKKVFIGDDTFGIDKKWAKEFCSKYAEQIKLPFICQLRVNLVNEELMDMLKRAGCVHVSCGVESGSPYIRNKIMKRNISDEQIIKAYALFKKYKMTSNAINIIGLPQETEKDIWATIKINRKINPTSSGVNIFYPYHGTELGDYCFEQGMVDEDAYSNFSKERRASVLKFPKEYQDKIIKIYKNWGYLVYGRNIPRLVYLYIKNNLVDKMPVLARVKRRVKETISGIRRANN